MGDLFQSLTLMHWKNELNEMNYLNDKMLLTMSTYVDGTGSGSGTGGRREEVLR